jgi:tetratricopeptide (TPR) repeat protein
MLIDISQKLPPLTAEETYAAFLNSLRFREGFGIIFLECSPGEANRLIPQVKQDLPEKNIEVLDLVKPIDNLYQLVEVRADRTNLNILFIRGLEKSLEDDVKPGYKGLGDYYNLNTVPPILSHLNQQRENFRDHFDNICFVFVLPKFAIRYFVRRAPDFYDWNSGLFEIADQKRLEQSYSIQDGFDISNDLPLSNFDSVKLHNIKKNHRTWGQKIFDAVSKFRSKDSEVAQDFVTKKEVVGSYEWANSFKHNYHKAWYGRGIYLANLGRYDEAIKSYDRAISFKPDLHEAWYYRGNALFNLGRYDEAITAYDRAVEIKPDKYEAWHNRGISLGRLGRYEEAVKSYDRAVEIKPDLHDAWYNRGISLFNLGRYEEAIASYDRAVEIKPDKHDTWNNRGNALDELGRYEEAIASYDRAVEIKPDKHDTWNNRGNALGRLGRYEEAIASYDRAVEINPDLHEAWGGRAISLRRLGRYPEAFDNYDQAITIKPDEPQYCHNKGFAYFKLGRYPESINCFEQAISIKSDKYDSWHDKGLVHFVTGDYLATLDSWQQSFNYISDPKVPRYQEDISGLIQEFIEELIPRFTQPSIQETLLIPLLSIYQQANVITELGTALVNTLHLIVAPTISDHTAAQWLELWRTSSLGNEPTMELPLRLMSTAIEYKKDHSKRDRLWLNLPSEERPILDKALKIQLFDKYCQEMSRNI